MSVQMRRGRLRELRRLIAGRPLTGESPANPVTKHRFKWAAPGLHRTGRFALACPSLSESGCRLNGGIRSAQDNANKVERAVVLSG